MGKLVEIEKHIKAIEKILNIRKRYESEIGMDNDFHVINIEDPIILPPWKEI